MQFQTDRHRRGSSGRVRFVFTFAWPAAACGAEVTLLAQGSHYSRVACDFEETEEAQFSHKLLVLFFVMKPCLSRWGGRLLAFQAIVSGFSRPSGTLDMGNCL